MDTERLLLEARAVRRSVRAALRDGLSARQRQLLRDMDQVVLVGSLAQAEDDEYLADQLCQDVRAELHDSLADWQQALLRSYDDLRYDSRNVAFEVVRVTHLQKDPRDLENAVGSLEGRIAAANHLLVVGGWVKQDVAVYSIQIPAGPGEARAGAEV